MLLANISLLFFNLLPAFPMDGGRALRALLACWVNYGQATRIAAGVGQVFAVIFGIVGLLVNPLLVLIAGFVWFGASQEAAATLMKLSFAGIPVRKVMLTDFRSLREDDTLSRAVDLILAGSQHDFPVQDGNGVTGLLTRTDLIAGLSKRGPGCHVADVMRREYRTIDASDPLEGVFTRIAESQEYAIPVMEAGRWLACSRRTTLRNSSCSRRRLNSPANISSPRLPKEKVMNSEARLFTMFAGWIMAFYGIKRRSWPGTVIAMLGLGLAEGAMTIGEGELR